MPPGFPPRAFLNGIEKRPASEQSPNELEGEWPGDIQESERTSPKGWVSQFELLQP